MKRNYGLDFLKFICCFMVICIHVQFPEPIRSVMTTLSRIAVPIFFMITGYFYSNVDQKKQLIKITKIFLCSNALYLLYSLAITLIKGNALTKIFNAKNFLEFVFLNNSPFIGHLWYLGAILYVLFIIYFFEKKFNREKLYFMIPFLLLVNLIFGKYSLLLINKEFSLIYTRNFLFVGLPYFLIGDALCKKKFKIKQKYLRILIFLFVCTNLTEHYLLQKFNLNAASDHYLNTTFLAVSCFLYACNYSESSNGKLCKITCFIGRQLSLDIYIYHPIIIDVFSLIIRNIINKQTLTSIYSYTAPFIVFFASIIAALLKKRLLNFLNCTKKTNNSVIKKDATF